MLEGRSNVPYTRWDSLSCTDRGMLKSEMKTCLSRTVKVAKSKSTGEALLALRRDQLGCLKSKPGLVARPPQSFVTEMSCPMFKGCLYAAV